MRWRRSRRLVAALGLLVWGVSQARAAAITSPTLERLRRQIAAGDTAAEAEFVRTLRTPLVEAAESGDRRLVTFVWSADPQGPKTERVHLQGGRPAADFDKPMRPLAGTSLWYLSELLPSDARFQYWITVNPPTERSDRIEDMFDGPAPQRDPLNPLELYGESYVVLPDAVPFPYPENLAAPKGSVVERSIHSPTLGATIELSVYLPALSSAAVEKPWLAIVFDGGFLDMQRVLDDRIATGRLPAMVVVGVHNREGMRPKDLGYSAPFARFVAKELLPWAQAQLGVSRERDQTILGGVSRGAGMVAFTGLEYPEAFSRLLCLATAIENEPGDFPPTRFWLRGDDGWIVERYVQAEKKPLRFFLGAARFDTSLWTDRLVNNRRFRDTLRAKGYPVDYLESAAGHDQLFFQLGFVEGLQALTRP